MKIEWVNVKELRPNEYNPKRLTPKARKEIMDSLAKFGFVDPLVVNKAKGRENIIIGGHQRWLIARDMGIEKVPVVYVDIPNIDKEKELCLRLSKNVAEFDWDALIQFDKSLLTTIGFELKEIQERLSGSEIGQEIKKVRDISEKDIKEIEQTFVEPKPLKPLTIICPKCGEKN